MAVFSNNTMSDLMFQARRLANNFFSTRPLIITADEFIAGFIDPEHIPVLKQTEDICGRIGVTSATSIDARTAKQNGLPLTLSFHGEAPIIIPNYVTHGLRPTAPEALRNKLQGWVEERWDYGCMFGDILDALEFYNVVCAEAKAMTVMIPIMPTLMRNITVEADSRTSKRARRLSEMKGVNALPSLPRAVTKRIHDACHLMTAANLIENIEPPKLEDGDVVISYTNTWNPPIRTSLFAGIGYNSKAKQGAFI